MKTKTFYEILGVKSSSSVEDIKIAYRKLAKKYHPDCSKTQKSAVRFREIQEAYEILADPIKKRDYDALIKVKENDYATKTRSEDNHMSWMFNLDENNASDVHYKIIVKREFSIYIEID